MNDTARNLILLGVAGVVLYFVYKDVNTAQTSAVSNSTADSAGENNLSTAINGLYNSSSGYLNQPVFPAQLSTSVDQLGEALGAVGGSTIPAFDSSGGNDDGSGED